MEVNASLINFAAGQLSKKFLGRVDLPSFYNAGCVALQNFIPQAQGPAEFRPGFGYIHHTRAHGLCNLLPFVFNDDQSYALAFSDQKLRFYSDGSVILGSAGLTQRQLLIHFDGADEATSYTAETGQVLGFQANAQLDTAQKVFGTASLLLDGSDDYVTASMGSTVNFGTGDFTVEFRVRFATVDAYHGLFSCAGGSSSWLYCFFHHVDNRIELNIAGTNIRWAWDPSADTWYHFSVVRRNGVVKCRVNGVALTLSVGSESNTSNAVISGALYIGRANTLYLNGWIDEFAISDTAIWDSDFTPPSAAYTSSNTTDITAITEADPGVITISSHGFTGGEEVYISGIEGMTELNDKYFLVTYIDGDTFSLTDIDGNAIDTSAYTTYVSGGTVEQVYEIDTPYEEADLEQLKFAQKADLMYIVHPDYAPRKLIRSAENSWSLATYTRTSDPFTKTITGITQANPGVVTATAHGFSNGDIIQIEDVVGMTEVNLNTYKVANKADNTFQLTDATTGANIDTSGFTAYTSGGVVFKAGNMPGAVAFYGGRLFFGGTDDDPETFWGSKAPDDDGTTNYDVFTVGANAEDAVTFPISSQNNVADRIQWFAGTSRFLGIGAYGGVYKANGGSDTEPIAGDAVSVQAVDFEGCKYIYPVRVGNALFYVKRGGLVLNSFTFSLLADDFKSTSLNLFSDEITDSGIVQLAIQQGTQDYIWAVTDDGRLIGMTVRLGEEVSAWHEHPLSGSDVKVLSVCGEPQPNNKDSLWVVTERTINGSTRRFIEYASAPVTLPEPEYYYTGEDNKATDDSVYAKLLYESAKELIHVDCSLSLDGLQTVALTPGTGATTAATTGVTFTAASSVFAATDVGRYIKRKYIDGTENGIALITGYTSGTVVTATIVEAFDSVTQIPASEWYLTFTSVTGLDHLEGETVTAQVDGADDEVGYTVSSGAITLENPATVAHIGLKYVGRITTMPLNIGAMAGTAQARITTVNRLGLLFRHTRATKYGTDLYKLRTVKDTDINPNAYRPVSLKTNVEFLNITDGYDRRKFVHIIQDTANPCTVQGIVPYVDTTNE